MYAVGSHQNLVQSTRYPLTPKPRPAAWPLPLRFPNRNCVHISTRTDVPCVITPQAKQYRLASTDYVAIRDVIFSVLL